MPWWFLGLVLAAVCAGWIALWRELDRRSMRRIEQKISADEQQWAEVLAAVEAEPHDYRPRDYQGYER